MDVVAKRRSVFALVVLMIGMLCATFVLNSQSNVDQQKIVSGIDIDNGDTKINWTKYQTFDVELKDSFEINQSGIYHLSGKIQDGMITVDVGDENGVVKLLFDDADIYNGRGPAVYVKSADDVVFETVEGTQNTLECGSEFQTFSEDEDVDGAIYSKGDLSFYGSGKLSVVSNYQDGIVGKDDVAIRSGLVEVQAADDGIRGKDSVYISGGTVKIQAKQDGIKATNQDEKTKGFVYIQDGEIEISVDDDGIHATSSLFIDGGKIKILKSYEGLEGAKVTINDGDIQIKSTDDGINVAGGKDESAFTRPGAQSFANGIETILTVNGGKIYVDASGDGLDSNGMIYVNGGEIIVDGPTNSGNGALDSENGIFFNGGNVIAVGASGMAESFDEKSLGYGASIFLESTQSKNTKIVIKDSEGNEIVSHVSKKTFNHIAVGSEKFESGEAYIIYINDKKYDEFTVSEQIVVVGKNPWGEINGQPGGMMPNKDFDGQQPPDGKQELMERPDGEEPPEPRQLKTEQNQKR